MATAAAVYIAANETAVIAMARAMNKAAAAARSGRITAFRGLVNRQSAYCSALTGLAWLLQEPKQGFEAALKQL